MLNIPRMVLWMAVFASTTLCPLPSRAQFIEWSETKPLNHYATTDEIEDQYVSVDSSPQGTVVAVWESSGALVTPPAVNEKEIFFARSGDVGKTWSNSAPINVNFQESTGDQLKPEPVFVGGTNWLVYWQLSSGGYQFTRSTDDGYTWTEPAQLSSPDFNRVKIASNQNGVLVLAAGRSDDTSTIFRSLDLGASWTEEHTGGKVGLVAHTGGTSWMVPGQGITTISEDDGDTWETVPSNHTVVNWHDIATDHNGAAVAITIINNPYFGVLRPAKSTAAMTSTRFIPVVSVVSTASSFDNGRTWTTSTVNIAPLFLHEAKASIACAGENQFVAAWSFYNSHAALSNDNGLTWGPAEQINTPLPGTPVDKFPDVAAVNGEVVVVRNTVPDSSTISPLGTDKDLVFSTADVSIPPPPTPIFEPKASIKLNFAKPGKDSIKLRGYIDIPADFDPLGAPVGVNIGGVERIFVLGAKGKANVDSDKLKLKIKSKKGVVEAQQAKVQVSLKKGNFAASLADENLENETIETEVTVDATISYGNYTSTADLLLFYKAKQGKTGKAK